MNSPLRDHPFHCREWVFHKLQHVLDPYDPNATPAPGVLVLGGPGSGKTALFTEIVWPTANHARQRALSRRVIAAHFCGSHDASSRSPISFVSNIVRQLRSSAILTGYASQLDQCDPYMSSTLCHTRNAETLWKERVVEPLLKIKPPQRNCLIIVDGIDELPFGAAAEIDHPVTIASLITSHSLPSWLRVLVSTRKSSRNITRLFSGWRKVSLDDVKKSQSAVRDIHRYMLLRLENEDALHSLVTKETAAQWEAVAVKSAGCILYVAWVLDGVKTGLIGPRELRHIPATLNGLYLWLCQRLFSQGDAFARVRPLFEVVLALRRPISLPHLLACSEVSESDARVTLASRLISFTPPEPPETSPRITGLFHHSFGEWVCDVKHCTQSFLCSPANGHAALAAFAARHGNGDVLDMIWHLSRANTRLTLEQQALWLLWSGANLEQLMECDDDDRLNDVLTQRLLLAAGADQLDDCSLLSSPTTINGSLFRQSSVSSGQAILSAINGGRVDEVDPASGQTALNVAARHGHRDVVSALLENGANVDHRDKDGWTPLRSAAWAGHSAVVELLLLRGATLDLADGDKRTALRAAAWSGHEDIVIKLLKAGAAVDKTDREGRTALIAAAYMGHSNIVDILISYGAHIDHADEDGRTALSVACLCARPNNCHSQVVNLLLERDAHVNHKDKDGMTPLIVAAYEGHVEVIELLLEAEAEVNCYDKHGRTALFAATSMGHHDVIKSLLIWGASVDSLDPDGRTVLSVSCSQGNVDVVKLLLERGLDENHRDNAGWTPLHIAAFEGHAMVCTVLTSWGAQVDATDNEGRSPLMYAAQEGRLRTVHALLDAGAPPDQPALNGHTPLRAAALEGHINVCEALLAAGVNLEAADTDGRSVLYVLAQESRVETAKWILQKGARVNTRDSDGRSPLMVACWQGHSDMMDLLIAAGANCNAADAEGRTCLQMAAWQGHSIVVEKLIKAGANVDDCCNQGATPLCVAAQEGHPATVECLLRAGADPTREDALGRSAAKLAAKSGRGDVLQILTSWIPAEGGTGSSCRTEHRTSALSVASSVTSSPSRNSSISSLERTRDEHPTHCRQISKGMHYAEDDGPAIPPRQPTHQQLYQLQQDMRIKHSRMNSQEHDTEASAFVFPAAPKTEEDIDLNFLQKTILAEAQRQEEAEKKKKKSRKLGKSIAAKLGSLLRKSTSGSQNAETHSTRFKHPLFSSQDNEDHPEEEETRLSCFVPSSDADDTTPQGLSPSHYLKLSQLWARDQQSKNAPGPNYNRLVDLSHLQTLDPLAQRSFRNYDRLAAARATGSGEYYSRLSSKQPKLPATNAPHNPEPLPKTSYYCHAPESGPPRRSAPKPPKTQDPFMRVPHQAPDLPPRLVKTNPHLFEHVDGMSKVVASVAPNPTPVAAVPDMRNYMNQGEMSRKAALCKRPSLETIPQEPDSADGSTLKSALLQRKVETVI